MTVVNARRPVAYLCVAGVLALGSLLLSGTGSPATEPPTGPPPPSAGASDGQPCGEPQGSLRPIGLLPAPGAMPPGSTMAAITQRGKLKVGVDQGIYRVSYRNPKTGDLAGSDIALAHEIAKAIFADADSVDRVQFIVIDIAGRVPAIEQKTVDVVVDNFTVTCDRQKKVEFSTAYLAVSQRVLVPADSSVTEIEDLTGKRVCTSRSSVPEKVLQGLKVRLEVVSLPGEQDCMVALQRGQVDAVSSDDVILAGEAAQDPQTKVVGRSLSLRENLWAAGMSPDTRDLVQFVNAVLDRGRADGSLAVINKIWFEPYLNPVPQPAPARYRD